MKKIMKYLAGLYILSSSFLLGCTSAFNLIPRVYKIPVKQGNVIDEKKIAKVKVGMTKEQAGYFLGRPVLKNLYNHDIWDYVYTEKENNQQLEAKKLQLIFENGKLVSISGNMMHKSK